MVNDPSKHVRVDNWGVFFLQRLQLFFSKTDYCDLTLQFEGNVQLKVHRLVINACTEYFQYLEQCHSIEENVILMPDDLQADVIVPIVNFMYTGLLQFHMSIYDKLHKAAEIMNITVLTKLLDAQKSTPKTKKNSVPGPAKDVKKTTPQKSAPTAIDLPAPLPGRKIPVWKRKSAPQVSPKAPPLAPPSPPHQQFLFAEQRRCLPPVSDDPLFIHDNTPKPTRFEWPDDDDNLPSLSIMDTSFDDISYTSKPLMTVDYEMKVQPSFDDIKHNVKPSNSTPKKHTSANIDMEEMKDYIKEQKIRSGFTSYDEDEFSDSYEAREPLKRKAEVKAQDTTASKKAKVVEKGPQVVHSKIITEILKKYPQLVKKNKNIKLKILAKNAKNTIIDSREYNKLMKNPKVKLQVLEVTKEEVVVAKPTAATANKTGKENIIKTGVGRRVSAGQRTTAAGGGEETTWQCEKCASGDSQGARFPLYYLYRKHMTDVHHEKFHPLLCKYCGRGCRSDALLLYHQCVRHGVRHPPAVPFAPCDLCPFVAFNAEALTPHRAAHGSVEKQCTQCTLTFTNKALLGSHLQITGHGEKVVVSSRRRFDCQYCTKKLAWGMDLLAHLAQEHRHEAHNDGVVSVDELDAADALAHDGQEEEEDEEEDEGNQEGEQPQQGGVNDKAEYVIPDILPDEVVKDHKVKILSNVKVDQSTPHRPHHHQQQQQQVSHTHAIAGPHSQQQQQVILEPSSEAEALSNVASGIATSLGLVDIVVLDDNQQYILQSGHAGASGAATAEYVLPEMGAEAAAAFSQAAGGAQGTQGGVLPAGDIASTDELVMVLTDHDYKDGQGGDIPNDNSNIVVLYSHPVDGQQGQFITSQGNLMVNSQGMLEIRNGATINTTASSGHGQLVVTSAAGHDTHIESIEMIQREIESQNNMKHDGEASATTDATEMAPGSQQLIEGQQVGPLGGVCDVDQAGDRVEGQEPVTEGTCDYQTQCGDPEAQRGENQLQEAYTGMEEQVQHEVVDEEEGKEEQAEIGQQLEESEVAEDQSQDTEQLTDNSNAIEEVDESTETEMDKSAESREESEEVLDAQTQEVPLAEGEKEEDEVPPNETDNTDEVDIGSSLTKYAEPEPMEVEEEIDPNEGEKQEQEDSTRSETMLNEEGASEQTCETEESNPSEDKSQDASVECGSNTEGYDVPPDLIDRSPPTLEIEEPKTSDGFPNPDNEEPPELEPAEHTFPSQSTQQTREGEDEPMEVDGVIDEPPQITTDALSRSAMDSGVDEVDNSCVEQETEVNAEEEQSAVGADNVEESEEGEKRQSEDISCDRLTESDRCVEDVEASEKEQPQHENDNDNEDVNAAETCADGLDDKAKKSSGSPTNFNDNSQSSAVSQDSDEDEDGKKPEEDATKISILNDWDDTDSQQSTDRGAAIQAAGETVHKLMDEWEEEEEDDNGKDYDN